MIEANINQKEKFEIELDPKNNKKGILNGRPFSLDLSEKGAVYHLIRDAKSYTIEVLDRNDADKTMVLAVNGTRYNVDIKDDLDRLLTSMGLKGGAGKQTKEIKAPMPGLVLDVLVESGQTVSKGDSLLILEAMKMENVIKSPTDGTIKRVEAIKGNAVEKNQVLIVFE